MQAFLESDEDLVEQRKPWQGKVKLKRTHSVLSTASVSTQIFQRRKKKLHRFLTGLPACSPVKHRLQLTTFRNPVTFVFFALLVQESGHFRFLRAACLANIKGSVGLILAKASVMRISKWLDLSSGSFIPLPRFIRSRRLTTLLTPSLVFSPLCSS